MNTRLSIVRIVVFSIAATKELTNIDFVVGTMRRANKNVPLVVDTICYSLSQGIRYGCRGSDVTRDIITAIHLVDDDV